MIDRRNSSNTYLIYRKVKTDEITDDKIELYNLPI